MLRDFNMIRRIGKIDEIQLRKEGSRGCEVRVACSDFKNGEESTAWFSVACFGNTAVTVLDIYAVGDQVFFSGTIDMESWTDKQSGKERTKMKLKAFRSRRLAKGKSSQEAAQTNDQGHGYAPQNNQPASYGGMNQQPSYDDGGNQWR